MRKKASGSVRAASQPGVNGYADLAQHMTPRPIADQMAGFIARPVGEWRVLDPACGDGNLLLAVIDRMKEAGIQDIAERVVGIDVDPRMVKKARHRIAEQLGVAPAEVRVFNQDFLVSREPNLFEKPQFDYSGFNVIISNPPYGQNREYAFFKLCAETLSKGTELVFLVPLAFLDRAPGVKGVPLSGRPMGVTTGHAIVHHRAGDPFVLRSIKEYQSNPTPFQVLTGVKLYELGGGTPPQSEEVVASKPFSSTEPKPGWIPCLRTGDVYSYRYTADRLFVNYGEHLAHPKELSRFQGPRLFLRRVPIWESRRLGAAYIEEAALCAGDVLVIRHQDDDDELLRGLCVFLNSAEAAEHVLNRRPSIRYRDSYPKFSAKDINELLEWGLPPLSQLRTLARHYPERADVAVAEASRPSLIECDFPVGPISTHCSREKSTRQGHISTLQMWWARRPLAVCRSAIFAALVPWPEGLGPEDPFLRTLDELLPGAGTPASRLIDFTGKLSDWRACQDESLLETARRLIAAAQKGTPTLADIFAGGGSFPLEALRLGLDPYASDLNPVAVTALKVPLELLPEASPGVLRAFRNAGDGILNAFRGFSSKIYGHTDEKTVLAYFWCRTYECPRCRVEVPLLKNRVLSSSGRHVVVSMTRDEPKRRFEFAVCEVPDAKEFKAAGRGTVGATGAVCPACSHRVPTSFLQGCCREGKMGDRLYAKRVSAPDGRTWYEACGRSEEALAEQSELRPVRNRQQKRLPAEEFDVNGIRHLWAMQYGIRTTADLFNHRQGIALLEVFHEIRKAQRGLDSAAFSRRERQTLSILLALTLNRLVMYNSRHSWWQPRGEFPANLFVRQAIPMVWNYVEIPVDSPGAGGFTSAVKWIALVAEHCRRLPTRGTAAMADAAQCELPSGSVDLVTLDPPYYDSVVYAYLADVFYVWMRPLLKDVLPDLFARAVTPKTEEAIVDRPHRLAPAPKGDEHFRAKMTLAFQEARRILKPTGKLLLMYGHKRLKAWDAVMSPLFAAGFTPVSSWPVHTERKVKLRHGHIAALSTSCLLVCAPSEEQPRGEIAWADLVAELRARLRQWVRSYKENHLYGSDLLTATIAPSQALFKRYERVLEGSSVLSLEAFLKRLPRLVTDCEIETLLADEALKPHKASASWLTRLYRVHQGETSGATATVPRLDESESGDALLRTAARYSEALLEGSQHDADALWTSLTETERVALRVFFEVVSLLSDETSNLRQRADASLGRIGMRLREAAGAASRSTDALREPTPGIPRNLLQCRQGVLLAVTDHELPVQAGEREHLVDLRVDAAQDEPAARGLQLLAERDQLAQGGARQVLHVMEVQEQLFSALFVH
jgi:adenine-specific DNA methylase/SAM-dependent methyltransferase